MANVTVNASVSNINVTTSYSNITVLDDGVVVSNITVIDNNIAVGTTENIISVAEIAAVNIADVRAALSNVAPILYDQANGIFSIDANALFSGKTTDDLVEGNTNLYYSNARVLAYVTDAGLDFNAEKVDDRVANLMQTTGNLTFTYNDAANTLTLSQSLKTQDIVEGSNLYFTNARVLSAITGGNVTLKQFQETYYNIGTTNGNVSVDIANGTIQQITLNGNITGLSFSNLSVGGTATLLLKQDSFGFRQLVTTSGWGLWKFVDNYTTLSGAADAYDALTVMWDGTNYYGSLVNFSAASPVGDITSVIAGAGLTGGGSSGDVTLNVGAGIGITVNADNIAVNMAAFSTTDLAEGANLYYTTDRANTAIGAYQGSISTVGNISTIGNINGGYFFGNGSTLLGITTTQVAEGANLYYTTDRANSAIGAYQGTINTVGNITAAYFIGDGSQLTGLPSPYSNANVQQYLALGFGSNNINTTGNITAGYFIGDGSALTGVSTLTNAQVVSYIATQPLTVGGNLTVNGNINATGNINYQNVTDLYVTDQKITLNSNAATNANVEIISNRPTATSTSLKWNEQSTRWEFTNNGTIYYPIATSTTDLAEGANLYYTTARANSAIAAYQGNINTTGNITGNYLFGNAAFLTGLPATYTNSNVTTLLANLGSNVISSTANITTTANVQGNYLLGNGYYINNLVRTEDYPFVKTSPGLFNFGSNVIIGTAALKAGTLAATAGFIVAEQGNICAKENVCVGNITGQPVATGLGNVVISNTGNITTIGNITTTNNVHADYFIGTFIGNIISTGSNVDVDLDFGTFTSNTDVQVAIDFGTF